MKIDLLHEDLRLTNFARKVSKALTDLGAITFPITDAQHGDRSGGTLHDEATTVLAGFMSAADKTKLDWLGSIEREIVVGLSGQVDDTSIASAIDTAVLGGASAATPWLITVKPGTYTEPPMNLIPGIALVSEANRINTVFVVASNANADLFTCTGGYVAGINVSGVTDPVRCLFRCATASTLTVFHGLSFINCSTGVSIQNGAAAILTNTSINLTGAGQGITTGIELEGSTSRLSIVGFFVNVPAALLPAYAPNNPIQTVIKNSGGDLILTNASLDIYYNDPSADGIFSDDGGKNVLFSVEISDGANATHIGSVGTNTRFIIQSANFHSNLYNGISDSATGVYLIAASADSINFSATPGTKLNGLIQTTSDNRTLIVGDSSYYYPDGNSTNLGEYLHELGSTGLAYGGEVTDAGGLTVDIVEGEGYCSDTSNHDIKNVEWEDEFGLPLTANSTNYVYYSHALSSIVATVAPPSGADILLATVITGAASIRFLHKTRNVLYQPESTLHDYLIATRKIAWESGLGTVQGSSATKLDINGGSYYVATELLTVGGGTDVTFSYFYGSGPPTEVTGQTDLDTTNYDNSGVLTAMTAGWYRADTVIVTSDNKVSIVYGTAEFNTAVGAEDTANKAAMLDVLSPTGCYAALVVVQQGVGINSIIDIRPDPNAATAGGAGGGGTNDHSALINLAADDHLQYFRVDGARALTGNLDCGGNNVTNVGLVDGVDVSGHASRHDPGAADALSLANPVAIQVGVAPSGGSANNYVRSDHQHGITAGNPVSITTANAPGTASSVARSDHEHDHGSQTNPNQHAIATNVANGFMSAADKTKLDGLSLPIYEVTQARRTTSLVTSNAYTSVDFDVTDVETDATKISHDPGVNPSRITVLEDGLYKIHYHCCFGPNTTQQTFSRVILNGVTAAMNGSNLQTEQFTGESDPMGATFFAQLSTNDYVELQVRTQGTAGSLLTNTAVMTVERVK